MNRSEMLGLQLSHQRSIGLVSWFIVFHATFHNISVEITTLVVIGTDCTGSCKSNYHMITTTTAPTAINS